MAPQLPKASREFFMAAVGLRAWQGRGIGHALLEAAISAERVSLFVHRDNAAALGFYARLGFAPTGRRVDDGPMHAIELLRAACRTNSEKSMT